jgi:hypothetical protein
MICYLLVGNKYRLGERYYLSSDPSGLTDNHPVPPGRVRLTYLSRHFVPGYLHLVPTGQRRFVLQQSARVKAPG